MMVIRDRTGFLNTKVQSRSHTSLFHVPFEKVDTVTTCTIKRISYWHSHHQQAVLYRIFHHLTSSTLLSPTCKSNVHRFSISQGRFLSWLIGSRSPFWPKHEH